MKDSRIKISVVLPVYNMEKYIDRCIDSLSNQLLEEMEFIFIDDCSTDKTIEKIKAFATKDSRVQLHQNSENIGAGASRNRGIEIASGEYLAFMDADDYVEVDYFKRLYHIATEDGKHDIAKGTRQKVDISGNTISKNRELNTIIKTWLEDGIPLYKAFTYEHNSAIFNHTLFENIDVRYGTGSKMEDVLFLFKVCNKTNDIVFDDAAIYYYVQKDGDDIRDHHYHAHHDGILALKETIDWIYANRDLNKFDSSYLAAKLNYCHRSYLNAMPEASHLSEQYNTFLNEIIDVIDYSQSPAMIFYNDKRKKLKKLYETVKQCPEISVVLPMYNCAEYVNNLLQSIASQSFKDFEVICVDDGSSDQTLFNIKEFCKTDSRFHFITKENGGAGSARNAGLEVARGKYMMFLDADDEYLPNYFQEMYETAEKYDVDEVFCLFEKVNYKTNQVIAGLGFKKKYLPADTVVKTEDLEHLYLSVSPGLWNTLFKKELIDKYHLCFSETKTSNDVFFIYAYATVAKRFIGIHKDLLRIRRYHNKNSLTSGRWASTEIIVPILEQLYAWLIENKFPSRYIEQCRNRFIETLNYNASFPYNDSFVKAYTKCICEGDMWKGIDDETFYNNYWITHDIAKLQRKINRLKKDAHAAYEEAQILSNRLLTIQNIEREAYAKYGRILNCKKRSKDIAFLKQDYADLLNQNQKKSEQIKKLEHSLEKAQRKEKRARESWNYRIGYVITWPLKKIYYGILKGIRFFIKNS